MSDHLYATCPILLRHTGGKPPVLGPGLIRPENGDTCGMCLRWYRSRTGHVGTLNDMEREVLICAASGLTATAAMRRMCVTPGKYRGHLNRALAKLGARTTAHGIVLALKSRQILFGDID